MVYVQSNQLFQQSSQSWVPVPQVPVQGINWGALLLTVGTVGLLAWAGGAFDTPERRCGMCGRTGHDARNCSQNPAKRARLRMIKTGRCTCCNGRSRRTEAHHYAGPADGTRGREMCGSCHLHCGHGGDYRNMAINPRYCRL
jgi:hypothetical protein